MRLLGIMLGIFGLITPAHASYIDPGSGSFLIQAILAILLGASVTFQSGWQRLIGWIRHRRTNDAGAQSVGEHAEDTRIIP